MAGHDRRAGQQGPEVGRAGRLARVRAQRLQVLGEDGIGAEQALDAHRGRDVGGPEQEGQVVGGHQQHAEHAVGAVDEGQALLLGQLHRLDAGGGQSLRGRHRDPGRIPHVALAHDRERAVGQRRQVAGAAEAAVLPHHRGDPGGEHRGVRRGRDRPDAGPAGRQRGQPQQHQAADDLALDLGARCPRRASGSGCAAAGPAARPGCAWSPGRRSRSRCRSAAPTSSARPSMIDRVRAISVIAPSSIRTAAPCRATATSCSGVTGAIPIVTVSTSDSAWMLMAPCDTRSSAGDSPCRSVQPVWDPRLRLLFGRAQAPVRPVAQPPPELRSPADLEYDGGAPRVQTLTGSGSSSETTPARGTSGDGSIRRILARPAGIHQL